MRRSAFSSLMIQGTTSDAGKSVLVTALCRILARRGISVAPFKPQNMALNSAVSAEGGEIGRAQAVQALACRIPASTDMNPVLLKPNSEVGSQVIVNGKAIGNMSAQQYHLYKPKLLKKVIQSYDRLIEKHSVVIVEGAGSPAEINLREHDIANMGFAEAVNCNVVVVSDIDRGGVFAHLYGTYKLLSQSEQQRVRGFIINRFRGDINLLQPGLDWVLEKTGVPVLAVVPYIENLYIDAEDSLSNNKHGQHYIVDSEERIRKVNICVPKYPRLSNHTDFDALNYCEHVNLEINSDVSEYRGADLILLAGSKNVREDLAWLKQSGWADVIFRHVRLGGKVFGICGGLQMLGTYIHDPDGAESAPGSSVALGLLDLETRLSNDKVLRNVTGKLIDHAITVQGYEIHTGVSTGTALASPLFEIEPCDEKCSAKQSYKDGACNDDGSVMASYLHGVFDRKDVLDYFLDWAVPQRHSYSTLQLDYEQIREQQIEKLADVVERALPIDVIYQLLNFKC